MDSSKKAMTSQDVGARPATRYLDDGYAPVPIMPPDADVSPLSKSVYPKVGTDRDPRGKVPGFIGEDGKWRSYDYRGQRRTRDQLATSDREGAGVGLLVGEQADRTFFLGLDCDTTDLHHATTIRDLVDERFGKPLVRVGRSPKALYPLRLSGPPRRMTLHMPNGAGKIELIENSQFVVEGVHPKKAGKLYEWPRGRLPPYTDLPVHDPRELADLLWAINGKIPGSRMVDLGAPADFSATDQARGPERIAPSEQALVRALAAIPNDHEHAPNYEDGIRLGNNIKAAWPEDPERALELFLEKMAEWEGPHGETNDPDEMERKFKGFTAERCGGFPTLLAMAKRSAGPAGSDEQLSAVGRIYFADASEVAAGEAAEAAVRASGKTPERTWADDWRDAVAAREAAEAAHNPRDVFGDGADIPDLPPPAGVAPKVLEDYAAEVAEMSGADLALTLASGIATMSAAVGYRLSIQPKQHDTRWTEGGTAWIALVAEPGSKKSPAMSMMTAPLSEIDAAYVREDGPRLTEFLERKSKRRKGEPDPGPRPRVRRAVVNGATFEALTSILADNPYGVLMINDELTGFLAGFNQYKSGGQGSDRALALSLFDGREARVDRAGKGLTYVERWGASQLGGIQPDKLRPLVDNLGADGLLQRYLPIIGSKVRRRGADRPPNATLQAAYSGAIRKVADYNPLFRDTVQLSPGARRHWDAILDRVDNLASLPGLSSAWLGHLGKWPAFAARLMLVAHVFDNVDEIERVDQLPVSKETAARTERLAGWFLLHSLRFYSTFVGVGQAADDARWIAGWLLSRAPKTVVHRGAIKQDYGAVRNDSARAARAMDFLAANDWCRSVGRYDRDGATEWEIFPEIYDGRFKSRSEVEEQRRAEARRQIEIAAEERRKLLAEQIAG